MPARNTQNLKEIIFSDILKMNKNAEHLRGKKMNINSLLGFLLLFYCSIALPMELESGELAPIIQEYDILFVREITELFTSHITQGFLEKSNKLFSDKKDNDNRTNDVHAINALLEAGSHEL